MQTEVAIATAASPSQGSGRIFGIIFGLILLVGAGYEGKVPDRQERG